MKRANCRRAPMVTSMIVLTYSVSPVADAAAEEGVEPIRLAYHASDGCPDDAGFVARIRTRTTRARIAWPGETARTFAVVIDQGPPASGRVVIQTGGRDEGTRKVQADTCSDVADALALVVALAIDPRASAPLAVATAPATKPSAQSVASPTPLPESESHMFFAGLDVAVATGVTPKLVIGGSPSVGWRARRGTLFEPSVRVAFIRAGTGAVDVANGRVEFTWTVGRVDVCPVVGAGGRLRIAACVRVEAGALEAMRADVSSPQTSLQPWVAGGAVARGEWSFFPWAFIAAEVGGLVRVTQERFYFMMPGTPVYQVPPVGVTGGAGVGIHFL
ncbi:MAG: hypothetical protein M3O46_06010 [Myxococcota bacterium]|nr:hypothetical protein [Myxococcota bacterium]